MSGDFKKDYPAEAERLDRVEQTLAELIETLRAGAEARAEAGRQASREIREALRQFDEGSMRRVGPRAISESGDAK
jgi:hypothetical protein